MKSVCCFYLIWMKLNLSFSLCHVKISKLVYINKVLPSAVKSIFLSYATCNHFSNFKNGYNTAHTHTRTQHTWNIRCHYTGNNFLFRWCFSCTLKVFLSIVTCEACIHCVSRAIHGLLYIRVSESANLQFLSWHHTGCKWNSCRTTLVNSPLTYSFSSCIESKFFMN
jgi:hypothetical protein